MPKLSQLWPGKSTWGVHATGKPEGVPKIAAAGKVAPKRCLSLGYKQQVDGKMSLNGMACVPSVLATTGGRHMGSDSCLYSIPGGSSSFLYLLMFSYFPWPHFLWPFGSNHAIIARVWLTLGCHVPGCYCSEAFPKSQVQNTRLCPKTLSCEIGAASSALCCVSGFVLRARLARRTWSLKSVTAELWSVLGDAVARAPSYQCTPVLLINVCLTMSGAYEVIITKSIPPTLIVQDPYSVTHAAVR